MMLSGLFQVASLAIGGSRRGAEPHRFAYKVWCDGNDWLWEVRDKGRVIAAGYAKTAAKARAQAMLFALSVGTERA